MDEKASTSFHEAGHCIQALEIEKRSFVSARIVEIRGRWEGDAHIEVRDIPGTQRVNIALAGIVAEGLGKAKEAKKECLLDEGNYEAFNAVAECVSFYFYRDMEPAWKVPIVAGGATFDAFLSRKDVENIPPHYRNSEIIIGTMVEVCRFFNQQATWTKTEKLAKLICDASPSTVGQFHLFMGGMK